MSHDDTFPDPYPKPTLKLEKLEPLPPPKSGWLNKFLDDCGLSKRAHEEADWRQRQKNLDDINSEFYAAAMAVWEIENKLEKRRRIERRIEELEQIPAQRARALATLETQVIDGFAEYQLRRDYFGDVPLETLRVEYRTLLRNNPAMGLLRETTNTNVRAIVGDVTALPALPSPDPQVAAELVRLKRLRDELSERPRWVTGEIARQGRVMEGKTGLPLTRREFYVYFKGMDWLK